MLQYTVLMCSSLASLVISFLATPALSAIPPLRSRDAPTVKVRNGTYAGVYSPVYNQDFFLGMPYSQPPVGDLRFRPAQSLRSSWVGVKNATVYSPECIGYGSDQWVLGNKISEDCLTLNVIRPSGLSGEALPVAVWIHGGGYTEGGSADPRYNLSYIIQQSTEMKTPFIGVSINYRLQAWGFIFGKEIMEEGSTNLGIRDQRLALHWVQENIAAFGGDPTKVTLWGESAGGFSIGSQLVAYGGRDDGCEYNSASYAHSRSVFRISSESFNLSHPGAIELTFYSSIPRSNLGKRSRCGPCPKHSHSRVVATIFR